MATTLLLPKKKIETPPSGKLYLPKQRRIEAPRKKFVVTGIKKQEEKAKEELQQYAEDLQGKTVPWMLSRWPQTNQELWLFVKAVWGVEIPYKRVCDDHVAPFQAFADAYFARHPVAIWKASRAFGGKTYLLSLLGSTEMVALGCFVTILGGSGEQSMRIHESMQTFFEHQGAPSYMVLKMTRFETHLSNGARARTLTASQKSVRGPHPQRLRLDECLTGDTLIRLQGGSLEHIDKVYNGTVLSTGVVVRSGCTGVKFVYRIRTVDEKEIKASENHPFYTDVGWVEVGRLLPGMRVATRQTRQQDGSLSGMLDSVEERGDEEQIHLQMRSEDGVPQYDVPSLLRRETCCEEEHLPRLRRLSEAAEYGTLPLLLECVDGRARYKQASEEPCPRYEEQKNADEAGRSCTRTVEDVRCEDRGTGLLPQMDSGLCSTRTLCDHRGTRGALARSPEQCGTRFTEEENFGSRGVEGSFLAWGQTAPLVDGFGWSEIVAVEPVGEEKVYNLAVEHSHVYEANDFLVHNCDEMEWEIFLSAQGQPMRSKRLPNVDTQTVASSTHQYADATMTKAIQVAAERGWPLYQWCWRETSCKTGGWLSMDEVGRKKKEISEHMWENEFELQEPTFGERAIDQDKVKEMFDKSLGEYPGHPTKYLEFHPPRNDRDYITGVDWAKMQHFTVVWTFDTTVTPWVCVAFQRFNRMPWPVIIKLVNMRIERFPGKLIHDATGLGSVVKDLIEVKEFMSQRDVKDQIMAGRERQEMFTAYIVAIERGLIRCPRIEWAYREHLFCSSEMLFGNGHPPDSVVAGALAWHMRRGYLRDDQVASPDMSEELLQPGGSPWKVFEHA